MANKWVTHDHSNYPPGGPLSSAYLADADEFNQNNQDICDAVGARYIRGVSCADKNSDSTSCEIWLQADGGARDVCDAGWHALIYYGASNVWDTTVAVSGSDCYVVFGDSQLENPATSGISDYSASAFIDALHIVLFPKKMMLPKDWVITTSGAGGGLSSTEIYHGTEPLSDFVDDVKDRLDTICKAGGGLADGVVDSTAIAGDVAVKFDSPVNLLAGGSLEHYGDEHDVLFKVEKSTPPASSYSIEEKDEAGDTDGAARAQKMVTNGSGQGFLMSLSPNFEAEILAGTGKWVAATFRVKTTVNNSLEVGFVDQGNNYYTDTPAITAGTWTSLTVAKEIPGTVTGLRAVIRSTTASTCTTIVSRVQMNMGDKCFGFSIGPYEDAARILMDTTQDNLFYNGGFERWTLSTQPDGWFKEGSATLSSTPGSGVAPGTGNKSCIATLDANGLFGQYVGLITDGGDGTACTNENILVGLVRGSKVCASVDLMIDQTSASDTITLVLGDRVDSTTYDEEEFQVKPILNEMRRYTVYKEITSDAKQVYFKIVNKQAATQHLVVDNAMLHVGEFPLKFKPSAGWREMRWDFSDETAEAGFNMDAAGIAGGEYPMPGDAGAYLMLKAVARCLTASDDNTTYQLYVDDDTTAEGVSITIAGTYYEKDTHVTTYSGAAAIKHECTQFIKAPECSETGTTAAAGVIFSVWGYYYAS
jgi:hypothetical protein